ncbi:putative MATE family efflux protein [Anaerosolibacter carboniphilus]|uniref:Probable multidrug resistance protein NorM n=1 Tax=Anaerosolibacter carboniphilus TaxID=1417629 RepID=A0A841KUB9_9FIRM|nr:MATE family efflux transporter [Anaerosolibacter carboniphilus]MBB6215778.1 putative MATE family efflux protein [Anaerosolibacter carboniphilus]
MIIAEKTAVSNRDVRKKIYTMIIPICMENVLQMLAGFISTAMIGWTGALAVSAMGLSMRITQIVWALFKGIATGGTVFVAQAYGAQEHKKLKHVIQQTLLSSVLFVIVIQQLIYWKADFFISWFNADGELLEKSLVYLKTVSFGLPFLAIMLVVAGVLQGMGNTKTPMKIALMMNLVNICASYVLIFGKLGFPVLGIAGAAVGTAFAQFVGAGIGLYVLFNKDGVLSGLLNLSFLTLNRQKIQDIYKMGMPTAFESIFWQICTIILTRLILKFGVESLAAHQLGLQAEAISYMPAAGFSIAATAFIGQAIGSKDPDLGKKYMTEIVKGSIVLTSFSVAILLLIPGKVMGLLTNDVGVIELGIKYLMLMAVVQIPQNVAGVLNGALRGAGFTKVPMIVAGTGLWLVRLPFAYILSLKFGLNIIGVWLAMTFDLAFRFVLSFALYKRKNIYQYMTFKKEVMKL